MPILRRTHTCGELRARHEGQQIVLNGWVNTRRDQGALVFINMRDRYGLTQVVFEADKPDLVKAAQELRSEFCIAVKVALPSKAQSPRGCPAKRTRGWRRAKSK